MTFNDVTSNKKPDEEERWLRRWRCSQNRMILSEIGEYVRYSDIQSELTTLRQRVRELEEALDNYRCPVCGEDEIECDCLSPEEEAEMQESFDKHEHRKQQSDELRQAMREDVQQVRQIIKDRSKQS